MSKEKLIEEIQHIQSYINQSTNDDYYEYEDTREFKREFCNKEDLRLQLNRLVDWIEDDKHLTA